MKVLRKKVHRLDEKVCSEISNKIYYKKDVERTVRAFEYQLARMTNYYKNGAGYSEINTLITKVINQL